MSTFEERLKIAMELRGLGQSDPRAEGFNELDRLRKKNPGTTSGMVKRFRDSGRLPKWENLEHIADALKIRVEWLAKESGPMTDAPAPEEPDQDLPNRTAFMQTAAFQKASPRVQLVLRRLRRDEGDMPIRDWATALKMFERLDAMNILDTRGADAPLERGIEPKPSRDGAKKRRSS